MSNMPDISARVRMLLDRGVVIPCPAAVEVEDSVDPQRIAPGVVIHAGCRIRGAETSIAPGCVIGAEAPATVEDCQLGRNAALKGGYFSGATFLDGASMGSGAHVRPGTLLEEEARAAPHPCVEVAATDPAYITDVDTPADVDRLRTLVHPATVAWPAPLRAAEAPQSAGR